MLLKHGKSMLFHVIALLGFTLISASTEATEDRPAVIACHEFDDYARSVESGLEPHTLQRGIVHFGEYPHMALIGTSTDDEMSYKYVCGASLISKKHLLTVAHCVYNPARHLVRLNFTSLSDLLEKFIQIRVKEVFLHPDYKPSSPYNDIAVIELERDVPFSRTCRPACLFTEKEPPVNEVLFATGLQKTNRKLSDTIVKFRQKIQPLDVCNASYAELLGQNRRLKDGIRESQLCAHDNISCPGFSGGPLVSVVDENFKIFRVIGLVSSGTGNCELPDLYTRVSSYLDFIEGIVWPHKLIITNRLING